MNSARTGVHQIKIPFNFNFIVESLKLDSRKFLTLLDGRLNMGALCIVFMHERSKVMHECAVAYCNSEPSCILHNAMWTNVHYYKCTSCLCARERGIPPVFAGRSWVVRPTLSLRTKTKRTFSGHSRTHFRYYADERPFITFSLYRSVSFEGLRLRLDLSWVLQPQKSGSP